MACACRYVQLKEKKQTNKKKRKKNLPQKLRTITWSPWPFLKVHLQSKRHGTDAERTHSQPVFPRRLFFVFTDTRHREPFQMSFRAKIRLLPTVSCIRLNQGHGNPSQTFFFFMKSWNVDFITIIFIQHTRAAHTATDAFTADTEHVNYTMT